MYLNKTRLSYPLNNNYSIIEVAIRSISIKLRFMANIIIIENDQRIIQQIRTFLNSTDESHSIYTFPNSKDLNARFFSQLVESEDESNNITPSGEVLPIVHLVIFNSQNLDEPFKQWIINIRQKIQEKGSFPENNVPRFMALKYEDDGIDNSEYFNIHIDDLVCLPLDRLLFLQKVEILLALPKKITPSFLFNQPASMDIEVSKKTQIRYISDFGLAIYNPVALNPGVITHFFFSLPNQKEVLNLYGKVLCSKKQSDQDKFFMVYFSYFGLGKETLKKIRGYLSKTVGYRTLINSDPNKFKFKNLKEHLSESQARIKTIVIIDVDSNNCDSIKTSLQSEMEHLNIIIENSYYLFTKKYLTKNSNAVIPSATSEELLGGTISWTLFAHNKEIFSLDTPLKDEDICLGHKTSDLFKEPFGWMKLFQTNDSKELLNEMFQVIETKQTTSNEIDLSHQDETLRRVTVKLKFISDFEKKIQVDITIPPAVVSNEKNQIEVIDAMIISNTLIPHDYSTWYNGLIERAKESQLLPGNSKIKIILMGDESPKLSDKLYKDSPVDGILFKPIENRRLQFLLSSVVDSPLTQYNFENIYWSPSNISVYVAKESHLEVLSEFGVTLRFNHKLTPGINLHLHGNLFDHNHSKVVSLRLYHTEESESTKGEFSCSFIYFGIDDAFLKFIRKWIRTNYAQKKASGSN